MAQILAVSQGIGFCGVYVCILVHSMQDLMDSVLIMVYLFPKDTN